MALEQHPIKVPSEAVVAGAGPARATTDERLTGRLRGELDAIASKALAHEAESRYANVAAFGDDLNRYLKGERVLALPEGITTADLVAKLSRNPKVRVTHRLTQPPATVEVRRRAFTALLTGKQVEVSVELLESGSSMSLWSRRYEVSLRDGSNVEGEVATTILEAVRAALDTQPPAAGWRLRVELADKK
jgi:TolB-like protein